MRRHHATPPECPVCGAKLPPRAPSCPDCGADERTGWNEDDTRYDGLDLPDSAFNDNDEQRPSAHRSTPSNRSTAKRLLWLVVGILLVIALIYRLLASL